MSKSKLAIKKRVYGDKPKNPDVQTHAVVPMICTKSRTTSWKNIKE